jgi:hypothetical protein
MPTLKMAYGTPVAVTITVAGLASSTTLLAGQESNPIDNTTALNPDYFIGGKITTGTGPTIGTIEVHVVAMGDDTNWPDVFDGVNSAETITTVDIKNSICRTIASITTTAVANQAYPFGPVSVASKFDGVQPRMFIVFVTHSTVTALNATATTQVVVVTPISYASV